MLAEKPAPTTPPPPIPTAPVDTRPGLESCARCDSSIHESHFTHQPSDGHNAQPLCAHCSVFYLALSYALNGDLPTIIRLINFEGEHPLYV